MDQWLLDYRSENGMNKQGGKLLWDTRRLSAEIVNDMKMCRELNKIPVSMSVDTWAVDYVGTGSVSKDRNPKADFQYDIPAYGSKEADTGIAEESENIFNAAGLFPVFTHGPIGL